MKQKTMDHELMARLNRESQEAEKRRFEQAKINIKRLENKRKVQDTGIIHHHNRWDASGEPLSLSVLWLDTYSKVLHGAWGAHSSSSTSAR